MEGTVGGGAKICCTDQEEAVYGSSSSSSQGAEEEAFQKKKKNRKSEAPPPTEGSSPSYKTPQPPSPLTGSVQSLRLLLVRLQGKFNHSRGRASSVFKKEVSE